MQVIGQTILEFAATLPMGHIGDGLGWYLLGLIGFAVVAINKC